MAYTEKVSLSGTALSFLLYECMNSVNSQEGFLIGDVTSQITNHISDAQNDNARLDTQIVIRSVLPLPCVSMFYLPTGRIKEDVLAEVLANNANEVVGWYKFRRNMSMKPTFRDRLISKGLQKYFEKHHGKKNFVTCNLSSRLSLAGSTHTLMYRFGKINCLDMYEYIEDVTANLGEKHTGYKKALQTSPHSIFNKIVKEINAQGDDTSEAILRIQQAVDERLIKEAEIAAKTESTIRQLEAEIRQLNDILADKQAVDLRLAFNTMIEEKARQEPKEVEIAQECIKAMNTPHAIDIFNVPNIMMNNVENHLLEDDGPLNNLKRRSPSPILGTNTDKIVIKPLNFAAALKNKGNAKKDRPSTSKANLNEDLIIFDDDDNHADTNKQSVNNGDRVKVVGDSSPEY